LSEDSTPAGGGSAAPIADSILRGYKNRKHSLSGNRLSPGDPAFFQNMLDRTQHVYTRQRIWRTNDLSHLPVVRSRQLAAVVGPPPAVLRVACVSSDLPIWGEGGVLSMEPVRDGGRLLKPRPDHFRYDKWAAARLAELDRALEHKPHMICFPEFAYPPGPDPKEGGWSIDEIGQTVGRRVEFEQEALKRLEGRNVFLVLGSFHCLMTLYNVAVIYPWGNHRHGGTEVRVEHRETSDSGVIYSAPKKIPERVRAPVMYRKRFPARKVGEQTRVPAGQGINIFECDFGKVMVLICSDVLDLNQFMMIVRENILERDIDFIVIPAYNPAESFHDICRDLSALSGATVIVANATDEAIGLTDSEVFVCGDTPAELKTSEFRERRDLVKVTEDKRPEGSIRIFDIKLKALKDARENLYRRLGVDDSPPEVGK
jgi:predicted amidohydrolase